MKHPYNLSEGATFLKIPKQETLVTSPNCSTFVYANLAKRH